MTQMEAYTRGDNGPSPQSFRVHSLESIESLDEHPKKGLIRPKRVVLTVWQVTETATLYGFQFSSTSTTGSHREQAAGTATIC